MRLFMYLSLTMVFLGDGFAAFLGIGSSNEIYKDPKLTYFAHNQLGDSLGSDLSIQEEEKTTNSSTKYIKITNTIQIPETESIKLIMDMLRVIWEAIVTGITRGFMPTVERFRRDTSSHKGWLVSWRAAVVYCTVLYCTVLYCTVWSSLKVFFLTGSSTSSVP